MGFEAVWEVWQTNAVWRVRPLADLWYMYVLFKKYICYYLHYAAL